jgi:hypothetical protein
MSLPALYEIAAEYRAAASQLADLDLPPEVVADTLEGLAGDLETKSTNVAMFIRSLEATAAQIKDAEAAMEARRKAIEARANHVRKYLLDNMQACGITKIESPWFKLSVRSNPPAVVIDNAGLIPGNLYVYPSAPEPYPDKKAIKAAIEAGIEFEGAHLERGVRLEIK